MKRVSVLSTIALVLFAAGICQADSLVITYRSGNTQTVVLDEPSQGINSWQFVGGITPQPQSKKQDDVSSPSHREQVQKESASQPQADVTAADKSSDKKSGIRVKWNAKPIAD